MIKRKSVDIIIPVYNTSAELLKRCLNSALSQTYKAINIILIDDGSTLKETVKLLKHFAKEKTVSLICQKNLGVSAARNNGLKHSSGDYVIFLDSDDYITNNFVEKLINVVKQTHRQIIFSDIEGNKRSILLEPKEINLPNDVKFIILNSPRLVSQATLIDGNLARSQKFDTNVRIGEDYIYVLSIINNSNAYYAGAGGYFYTDNKKSVTNNISILAIDRYAADATIIAKKLEERFPESDEFIQSFKWQKLTRIFEKLCRNNSNHMHIRKKMELYRRKLNIKSPKYSKGRAIKSVLFSYMLYFKLYNLASLTVSLERRI